MTKNTKSQKGDVTTPSNKSDAAVIKLNGWTGLLLAFVCVSVAYADYLVIFGTSDMTSKYMLIPNVIAMGAFAIYKAVK